MKAVGFIIKTPYYGKYEEEELINNIDKFNFDIVKEGTGHLEYVLWHEDEGYPKSMSNYESFFKNFIFIPKYYDEANKEIHVYFERPVEPKWVILTGVLYEVLFDDGSIRDLEEVVEFPIEIEPGETM